MFPDVNTDLQKRREGTRKVQKVGGKDETGGGTNGKTIADEDLNPTITSHYTTCKWTKHSTEKTELIRLDKKITTPP